MLKQHHVIARNSSRLGVLLVGLALSLAASPAAAQLCTCQPISVAQPDPLAPGDVRDCEDHSGPPAHDHGTSIAPGVDVSCSIFTGVDLRVSVLDESVAFGTAFDGADLRFATLGDSDLREATFLDTDPGNPSLGQADLSGAGLQRTDLSRADFTGAWLGSADLSGADLTNARFRDANLLGARMVEAFHTCASPPVSGPYCVDFSPSAGTPTPIRNAILDGVQLPDSNFSNVDLSGSDVLCSIQVGELEPLCASFVGSSFSGANLFEVNFSGADMTRVDLTGADLTNARLDQALLNEAGIDCPSPAECIDFTDAILVGVGMSQVDLSVLPADALQVIKNAPGPSEPPDTEVGLTGADLSGSDLGGLNLVGLEMSEAVMSGARLAGVSFDDASDPTATPANLQDAILSGLIAPCTSQDDCVFFGDADLTGAQMQGVNFTTFFETAGTRNYSQVDLRGSTFFDGAGGTDLACADFSRAEMEVVNLEQAQLNGVDFTRANLGGVTLLDAGSPCSLEDTSPCQDECASFVGAILFNAALEDADLSDARFWSDPGDGGSLAPMRTDFTDAFLARASLEGAIFCDPSEPSCSVAPPVAPAPVDPACDPNFELGVLFDNTSLNGTSFAGAQLQYAELKDVTAVCDESVNPIRCTNLAQADFGCADLGGSTFVAAILTATDFTNVQSFDGTILDGATDLCTTPQSGAPECVRFSGARLDGVSLFGVAFTNPALADVFQDVATNDYGTSGSPDLFPSLRRADLASTQLYAPLDLGRVDLGEATLDAAELCGEPDGSPGTTECANLVGAILTDTSIRSVDFSQQAEILGPTEGSRIFQNATGVRGIDLGASNVASQSFDGLDLTGASFQAATLCAELSTGPACASFDGANLTDAVLDNTLLTITVDPTTATASFTGATLTGTSMRVIDFSALGQPDFFLDVDGDLTGIDLGASNLDGMNLGARNEAGQLVTAPTLAEADLSFASVIQTSFEGAELQDALLDGLVACPVGFQSNAECGDFSTARVEGVSMRDVIFALMPTDFFAIVAGGTDLQGNSLSVPSLKNADFGGALLAGYDLANAYLGCADFTGADLTGSTLTGVTLDSTILAGATLTGLDFSGFATSFFQDLATPEDCETQPPVDPSPSLASSILYDARFDGLDMSGIDFTDARYGETSFQNANLAGSVMDQLVETTGQRKKLCDAAPDPAFDCLQLDGAAIARATPADAGLSFRDVDLSTLTTNVSDELGDRDVGGLQADTFQSVAGGNLAGVDFSSATISGLDLSGLDLTEAEVDATTVFCSSDDPPVCSSLDGAILHGVDFAAVNLRDVPLSEADFTGAVLRTAVLDNLSVLCAETTCSDTARTRFTDADMRGIFLLSGDLTQFPDLFQDIAVNDACDCNQVTTPECTPDPGADLVEACRPNLQEANLSLTDLTGMNLRDVNLSQGSLAGANLTDADLTDADLESLEVFLCAPVGEGEDPVCADLTRATLVNVDLRAINFNGSTVTAADFSDSDLRSAQLNGIVSCENASNQELCQDPCDDQGRCLNLTRARLFGSSLQEMDFTQVVIDFDDPESQDVRGADLLGANFQGLALRDVDFSFANFTDADLTDTTLDGSVFRFANFGATATSENGQCFPVPEEQVDLRGAFLGSADFSEAVNFLRGCLVVDETTVYTAETRFPPGFDLQTEMTPEPGARMLQLCAVAVLTSLRRRRRARA